MLSAARPPTAAPPAEGSARRGGASEGGLATATSTAILFATTADADGAPAAALPWEDGTVLGRLLAQLGTLGIRDLHVITRPGWDEVLRPAAPADLDVHLHVSPAAAEDATAVAAIARRAPAGLALMYADIVTHREALAGVLADPRHANAILATPVRRALCFRVRLARGRVVSASSPYHAVHRPTTTFLGVVKIAPQDREALAAEAGRVAAVLAGPLPGGWEDELGAKAERWRIVLAQRPEDVVDDEGPADLTADPDADHRAAAAAGEHGEPLTAEQVEAEAQRRLRVVREDVLSLLLVALVRSGVHVGTGGLRKLFWSRPLSREAIDRASQAITGYDEDRVLLDSAVKAKDGFFTTYFVSPYSKYIARWFARRGWTPNGVTTLSMAIGILAAVAFATGERAGLIAGAVLLQVAFTFDCVDGQLARYTRQFSKLGAWLDSVFDRAKEYAVFAGLAIGASRVGDPVWVLAGAALALQTTRHLVDFSFAAAQHQVIGAAIDAPFEQSSDTGRPPRTAAQIRAAHEAHATPEPEHDAVAAERPRRTARDLPRLALRTWGRIDRIPSLVWFKRIIAFPIGERFAAISIAAAVAGPRTAFTVLLIAGGIAAVYTFIGRFLRSVAS